MGWYWGLEGWQWVAATVGMVVSAIAGFFVLVILAGKSIFNASMPHDVKRCDCANCVRRRGDAWARLQEQRAKKVIVNPRAIPLISTRELQDGMLILSRYSNVLYRVESLEGRSYGWLVFLRNQKNNRLVMVTVKLNLLDQKIWIISSRRDLDG